MSTFIYTAGKRLQLDLPKTWALQKLGIPKEPPIIHGLDNAIIQQLEDHLITKSLSELVNEKKTVTILIDDQTRPTPVSSILPILINYLNLLNIPDESITIIMARGTHREPSEIEIKKKVGKFIYNRFDIKVHDPDDEKSMTYLGKTTRETPVWVNSIVAKANVKIGIGTVVSHYFTGFSGGPKIVLPGVCSRETIAKNHFFSRDPNSKPGMLDGNPVWEDMLEVARMLKLDVKIDVVLNLKKEIVSISIGEVEAAQKRAVQFFKEHYGIQTPKLVDVTIASAYPLEADMIQSAKALIHASMITKDNGTIILAAECSDGEGPGFYEALCSRPKSEEIYNWILNGKTTPTGGPPAARVREQMLRKKIVLVTEGLPDSHVKKMGFECETKIQDAISKIEKNHQKLDVAVLPLGGATLPIFNGVIKS